MIIEGLIMTTRMNRFAVFVLFCFCVERQAIYGPETFFCLVDISRYVPGLIDENYVHASHGVP